MYVCMYVVFVICIVDLKSSVFRLLTDFVCLYNYEFGLSLCKIVRSSVILLLLLFMYVVICIDFKYNFIYYLLVYQGRYVIKT